LRSLGHHFFSSGDTEVVLKAYNQWGKDCVERRVAGVRLHSAIDLRFTLRRHLILCDIGLLPGTIFPLAIIRSQCNGCRQQ
jgi:hypothetical protein